MNSILLVFTFFRDALLLFGSTYLVGLIFLLPFGRFTTNKNITFFSKMLLGFILTASIYAVWFTKFYTILSIVFILYLIVFSIFRSNEKPQIQVEWGKLILFSLTLPVFTLLQLLKNGYFNKEVIYLHQIDVGIYTAVANYLPLAGLEVSSPWYQLLAISSDHLAKPYHYADLWFLSYALKISQVSPIEVFTYIYLPVLSLIILTGLTALFATIVEVKIPKWQIALISLIALVFNMSFPEIEWSGWFDKNIFMDYKVFPLLSLILAALLAIFKNKIILSAIITSLIPVFSIIYAPIVFGAYGLWLVIRFLSLKINIKDNFIALLIILIAANYIVLFYILGGSLQTSSVSTESKPGGYWFWLIKELAAIGVKYTIFNSLLLIIAYPVWQKRKAVSQSLIQLIYLCTALIVMGAVFTAILNHNAENFQFNALTANPITSLLFLVIMAVLYNLPLNKISKSIISIIVMALGIYSFTATFILFPQRESAFTKDFIEKSNVYLQNKHALGAFISNQTKETTYTADPRICYFCNFLKALPGKDYWANSLNVPESLDSLHFQERRQALALSPFYRFIQNSKSQSSDFTYEKAQIQFINEYKVDFIIIEKGAAIPEAIAQCTEHMLQDSLTGHRLLILNRPCASSSF